MFRFKICPKKMSQMKKVAYLKHRHLSWIIIKVQLFTLFSYSEYSPLHFFFVFTTFVERVDKMILFFCKELSYCVKEDLNFLSLFSNTSKEKGEERQLATKLSYFRVLRFKDLKIGKIFCSIFISLSKSISWPRNCPQHFLENRIRVVTFVHSYYRWSILTIVNKLFIQVDHECDIMIAQIEKRRRAMYADIDAVVKRKTGKRKKEIKVLRTEFNEVA